MGAEDWRARLQKLLTDWRQRQADATSAGHKPDRIETARAWHGELVDNNLAAPGWPKSVGGLELSLQDQLDYYRMTTAAGAPPHPCPLSFIVAPTLIRHGTAAQKDRFLRPLLRADEFWCQGFSEPGAGSDLASLSTRAVRDGDMYRVTGQKVWTSMADRADWMFALVRTGPPGRSTEGITYLLIPMNSPGIAVRPLRDISGAAHFAEVFLDDVAVPVENRVGAEGEGWSIMRTSLGHERATAFLADEFKYRRTVDKVIGLAVAQGLASDPLVRQDIARLESGVRTIAANSARALAAVLRGEDPGGVASVNRLVKSEFEQHLHALALRALGPYAVLGSRAAAAVDTGRWTYGYLMSRATTIGAGTAEIQRNTIAETVLGLPSHRGDGAKSAAVVPGAPLAIADEDERALREVLCRALETRVDLAAILDVHRRIDAMDADVWSALVEFGLPGLASDESLGGTGARPRLLYAALEEAGKALAPAPLVATLTALEVAARVGAAEIAKRIIAGIPAAFAVPVNDCGWVTSGLDLPEWDGSQLCGLIPLVAGAPVAEVMLVLARTGEPGTEAIVSIDPADDTVVITPQQSLDLTSTIGSVAFNGAVGELVATGSQLRQGLRAAHHRAVLAVAADSVGVGSRALAMAVHWAGQREQFGRPIGSFQAVSHRCADMLVALEGARSQVLAAADALDTDRSGQLVDLAAATAFDAAVAVTEAAIQVHGGVGFTWEHPAHLLLRRAQANAVLVGRASALRDRAAGELMGEVEHPMKLGMGPQLEEFRDEVRAFIDKYAPEIPPRAGVRSAANEAELMALQQWTARLYDAGYAGADWPREYGGRNDYSTEHAIVVGEELARAQVPGVPSGSALAAHALIHYGTDEQRRRHLPAIRAGRELWCQLFSEPEAGSDLASLRTRAVVDGDGYTINGQKVWTTDGHWAQYGYLLARTDPEAPKHKGISAFILDMSAPGVSVRPLRELTGTSDFNEVFFDDVQVPADAMIGAPGEGWRIATATLSQERANVGAIVVKLRLAVDALTTLARNVEIDGRPGIESDRVRDRIGQFSAEVEALAALTYANITRWSRGTERPHDAAMAKLMFSELNLEIARFALELQGESGVLTEGDPNAVDAGRWQDEWLYARAYTIAGGSSEIMRTLIAERGLGLPREGR